MGLPITPSEYGKLEQKFDKFTFRNEGEFKIPKERREIAYQQSIDVIVRSVDFNVYENSKAKPSIEFYGYAVLVFQDCISTVIPIQFPRQRIYEFWNWEALRQWNEAAVFWEHWQYYQRLDIELQAIKSALGIPNTVEYTDDFGDSKFVEGTLRECYIKLQKNSQFDVEYGQWQPIEYDDPLGNKRKGESNQEDDPEKDDGLPKDGIKPKRNEPSNPFGGNPSNLGTPSLDNGFFIDGSRLNETDPNNDDDDDDDDGMLYWIEFTAPRNSPSWDCETRMSIVYIPIPDEDHPYSISFEEIGTDCGIGYGQYTFISSINQEELGTAGWLGAFGGVATYGSGFEIPPSQYYIP